MPLRMRNERMVEHIDDARAETNRAGRSRLCLLAHFRLLDGMGQAGMTTLTQVRKPLSVLGEPEDDAACEMSSVPERPLTGIPARSGFVLRLPYLPGNRAPVCPQLPRNGSFL